jgi:hypothetical protein
VTLPPTHTRRPLTMTITVPPPRRGFGGYI